MLITAKYYEIDYLLRNTNKNQIYQGAFLLLPSIFVLVKRKNTSQAKVKHSSQKGITGQ